MTTDADIPEFCGFDCPYADFPPADSAGLCRTMAAVQCNKLGKLVDKNTPCQYLRIRSQTGRGRGRKKK